MPRPPTPCSATSRCSAKRRAGCPQTARAHAPTVEWTRIIRSCHIVVHHYFGVDREIVWRIVEVHLPPLREALRTQLDSGVG